MEGRLVHWIYIHNSCIICIFIKIKQRRVGQKMSNPLDRYVEHPEGMIWIEKVDRNELHSLILVMKFTAVCTEY